MEEIRAMWMLLQDPSVCGFLGLAMGWWFGGSVLRRDSSPRPRLWGTIVRLLVACVPGGGLYVLQHTGPAVVTFSVSFAAYVGGGVISMIVLTLLQMRRERERPPTGGGA